MSNFGDFQNEVYAEAVQGVTTRYPFDFASIERKASEALPDWVYRYVSAAAGDAGSYDEDGSGFNDILSVDHPAADPYMVAAGGTTLPGEQVYTLNNGKPCTVNVPTEIAWSWTYLDGLCAALKQDPTTQATKIVMVSAMGAKTNGQYPAP